MAPTDHQPYRESMIQPICAVCGEEAGVGCARCGASLCESHDQGTEARCPSCEDHFDHLAQDRKAHPLRTYQLGLSYLAGILLLFPGLALVDWLFPVHGWDVQYDRTFAIVTVALLGAAFPLFAILYRRRRLRPKFLAERPERRHLRLPHKPPPKPSEPSDELSVGAFVLSLMFFVPLVPLVGGLLGLAVVATRKGRRRRLLQLGFAAAPLGLTVAATQFVLVALMVASNPFI